MYCLIKAELFDNTESIIIGTRLYLKSVITMNLLWDAVKFYMRIFI